MTAQRVQGRLPSARAVSASTQPQAWAAYPAGGTTRQEVRPVPVVEAERRLGQARRGAIRGREVAPESVGGPVHGLPPDRGAEAVRASHGRHWRRCYHGRLVDPEGELAYALRSDVGTLVFHITSSEGREGFLR